ncbi:DUF2892 domain-containing protein [Halorussus salinisoli]|uniref:DUF2892 domain-containing protein n=1 Tax=Halorussus salinisoli TaxID=2558242 RepID=UPI0010C1D293|nr:DUF2892 domain-containing protein [Halorussus salinisoli]
MDLSKYVGGRSRLARRILAIALTVVAISSLRKGKRLSGILAGVGALALGYDATSESSELTETLGIDTTSEEADLHCAECGQPIRPGQRRGPNANDEIVHDDCAELAS